MRLPDLELAEFGEVLAEEMELQDQRLLEATLEEAAHRELEALQFDIALDRKTERSMRDRFRRRYKARVRTIPGHQPNSPGPDALALVGDKLYILDNKGGREGSVGTDARGGAGGLSALSLTKTLPAMVRALERSTDPRDKAMLAKVKLSLAQAKRAVGRAARAYKGHPENIRLTAMASAPMPAMRDVRLVVTNAGGKSKGVSPDLRALGVEHVDLAGRKTAPLPRELPW